jgi:DNA polymerase-1
VIQALAREPELAFDCETEGFHPWKGDRLFSIAIASKEKAYYFPFELPGKDLPPGEYLPREWIGAMSHLWDNPRTQWIGHNIKFDMNFLASEGVKVAGPVYCTQTMARVEYNDHMKYSLEACAQRAFGEGKDAVKEYMNEHKLYEMVKVPGKETREKNYFFYRVPLEIIAKYAEKDARLAFDLKQRQSETFKQYDETGVRRVTPVVELEQETTRVLHRLQTVGMRVDRQYCEEAIAYETQRIAQAEATFERLTGKPLVDSAKGLRDVLSAVGIEAGKTEKGNDSYSGEVLRRVDHPVARAILEVRDAHKRAGTYFSAFLYHSSVDGRIHSDVSPEARTGRFSANSPNIQNLSDEEAEADAGNCPYPVRRAFVPDPGKLLVSIDYKAQEFRMMLDQACQLYGRETPLLVDVRSGKDPHTATADNASQVGTTISRHEAKISNFLTIYGGGIDQLAATLGCSRERAQAIRGAIFEAAPEIKMFMRKAAKVAELRGYVCNWLGRRYHFPDSNFSYKAPNYLIQGGCADVMRVAMRGIDKLFEGTSGQLLLTIHDEVVFQIDPRDQHLIPEVQRVMREAYPHKYLPLESSVAVSAKSLGDLEDWVAEEAYVGM